MLALVLMRRCSGKPEADSGSTPLPAGVRCLVFFFFFLSSTSSVLSQVYAPVLLAMILKSISLRVRHEKVTQQLTSGTSSLV